jgi:hypothetical protein
MLYLANDLEFAFEGADIRSFQLADCEVVEEELFEVRWNEETTDVYVCVYVCVVESVEMREIAGI